MMFVLLSLRMLVRDWRSGELQILAAALMVAVAGITSVSFFTDRIGLALERQATELLGADVVVSADRTLEQELEGIVPGSLRRARSVEFPSMVISESGTQLASIKAVSNRYPLRGNLRISRERFAPDEVAKGIPEPGSVWLESRLMGMVGIEVGDSITLGDADFRVSAILTGEPVANTGMLFSIAPRVLMNFADLDETGLIQPASRVKYQYLFAGEPRVLDELRGALEERLTEGARIEAVEDAQPQVRRALERAHGFLSLAALVSVLLAGVAVAMSARRFIIRHLDGCAVMRCLGARQWPILELYALQLLWLGLAAAAVGSLVGWLAQYGLVWMLGAVVEMSLPAPSLRPVAMGLMTALVTLLGFALPPLLDLKNVPALRVLRRELGGVSRTGALVYLGGAAAIILLIFWHARDTELAFTVLYGTAGSLAVLALAAAGLILLLRRIRPALGPVGRFSLLSLTQRSGTAVIQVMAFGLGITVLLLLLVVRDDLVNAWERTLPPEAPNRFLINIQPDQLDLLRDFFDQRREQIPEFHPMVRGRLVKIEERSVGPENYQNERARRLVAREFNLSWAAELQEDNRITAGSWWNESQHGASIVSVEKGLAETLGIDLGDRLVFEITGDEVAVEVASLREVDWDSFHANFFVLAPPGVFDGYPTQYISSFHVPAEQYGILNELVRTFPNITVIDVAAIMERVRLIMDRVALAVEYVFLFTLLSGLLVMYAAVYSTLDERIRETVLLRTLGAERRQLLRGLAAEFTTLGLIAGVIAATAAGVLGWVLSNQVFHLDYRPGPWLWLIGAAVGAIGVGAAGVLGTRFILHAPPIKALRETL